jgi:RHS repeat-associated protein
MGRPLSMRDALGRETRVTYDAKGRRTSLTLPDGSARTFAYDAAGHLARAIDALGRTTRYTYGGLHALQRIAGPDGRTWRIEYTREERVKAIVNPLGEEYTFERDLAGRVVSEKTFDGREIRYKLDGAGRIERIVQADGQERTFAFDRSGRTIRDATSDDAITYQRDVRGHVVAAIVESQAGRHETRFERDANGHVVGEVQGDRRVRYENDREGRRVGRVLPNGATTRYAYDAAGALGTVEHDGFQLQFERDAVGREASRTTTTGVRIAREYDALDRLADQRVSFEPRGETPSPLAHRRWSYDRGGRLERIDDDRWGETSYAHDVMDRVVEARRTELREAFEYDTTGAIVTRLEELDGRRREAKAEIGPGGVLLRDGDRKYANDARGRRVRKVEVSEPDAPKATHYEWDGRDRLRAATLPDGTRVTLAYDALGRRIRKEVTPPGRPKARITDYVWDGSVLAMQLDSLEGVRAFVHAPESYTPLLQQERGEIFTYVLDHMGTPKELVTSDGLLAWASTQSAWGRVIAEHADPVVRSKFGRAIASPFRRLGEIADDELGLTFTRYRLFDPEIGRWLSPDPLALGGGSNVFAFNGAPNLAVDPLGLEPTGAASGPAHGGIPDTTYRRDTRDPATIFKDGFQPRGTSTDLKDYVVNNAPSVYVGTTTSKSRAAAGEFCDDPTKQPYVYTVHPQTGVDVNKAMGSASPFPDEKEIAVPGGIQSRDIEGGQQVNRDGTLGPMIPNPSYVPR